MAKDFSAKQIRVSQLLASGGISGKPGVGLVIYSASRGSDYAGSFASTILSNIGSDTFLFVSGSTGSRQVTTGDRSGGVTVFGGDVVVSGTMYMEKFVAEVTSVTDSDHYISGSIIVEAKNNTGPQSKLNRGLGDGDETIDLAIAIANEGSSGGVGWDWEESTEKSDALIWESGGTLNLSASNDLNLYMGGDGSFATFQVINTNKGATSRVLLLSGSGAGASPRENGTDVNFYVSGSKSKIGVASSYGIAVFGGDLVISGTTEIKNGLIVDNTTFVVDETFNRVGVGTASPNAKINVTSDTALETLVSIEQHNSNGDAPNLEFVKSRGTYASPSVITSGDYLGDVSFRAWDGDSEDAYARFWVQSFGTISNSSHPARFVFNTCVDGSTSLVPAVVMEGDRVAILETTTNITSTDTNFFVSGSIGSHGTAIRGTALFGGDLVTSGVLRVFGVDKGDGKTAIVLDNNATSKIVWDSSADGAYPDAAIYEAAMALYLSGASGVHLTAGPTATPSLSITGSSATNQGICHINPQYLDVDFQVSSQNKSRVIYVDAGNDKLAFLSGSGVIGGDGKDVALFVSGTEGSAGSAIRGTALFGGDLVTSGVLKVFGARGLDGSSTGVGIILDNTGASRIVWDSSPDAAYPDAAIWEAGQSLYLSGASGITMAAGPLSERALDITGGSTSIQGIFHVNPQYKDFDFQVSSQNKSKVIYVDAGNDKLALLSGSGITGGDGVDVNLFVSGTEGSKGTAARGTALFGGDLVTSGVFYVHGKRSVSGASAAIVLDHAGGSAIVWDSDVDVEYPDAAIYETSQTLVLSGNGGVQVYGDDLTLGSSDYGTDFIAWGETANRYIHWDASEDEFNVRGAFKHFDGSAIFNQLGGDFDFTVETQVKSHALHLDSGLEAVFLMAKAADILGVGTDVSLFVSGSVDSHGTAVRGVAVFGGDAVISGALYLEERAAPGTILDGTVALYGKDDGGVTKLYFKNESGETEVGTGGGGSSEWTDGGSFLRPSDSSGAEHIVIGGTSLGAADILLSSDGGAAFNQQSNDVDFRVESNNKQSALLVDGGTNQVVILGGGITAADSYGTNAGTSAMPGDINFFVSGSINSHGTAVKGTSLFGGDVVVSGALYLEERSAPGTILDGTVALYGKDDSGVTKLYFKNESGETLIGAAGSGAVSAVVNGADNRLSTFSSSDALNGEANLTFDGTDLLIAGGGKAAFRDNGGEYIYSVADGTIGIAAGSEIDLTATTIDINGIADVSGNLTVGGDILTAEYIRHNGDTDTYIRFENDKITITAGGLSLFEGIEASTDEFVVNNAQTTINFRVEGDTTSYLLYADAANDRVVVQGATGDDTEIFKVIGNDDAGSGNNADLLVVDPTLVCINGEGNDVDFRVESSNNEYALSIDAGFNTVAFGTQYSAGTDSNFFVSGSTTALERNSTIGGVASFGGDVFISGSLKARQIEITHHAYAEAGDANQNWIPWYSMAEFPSVGSSNSANMPFLGKLVKVVVRGSNAMGETAVGIHRARNGDALPTTATNEEHTVNMSSANTAYEFLFTGSNHYSAGENISVSVDPAFTPGNVYVSCVFENEVF